MSMSAAKGQSWVHARGRLELDACAVMAIVNVTPDSFSDGGRWVDEQGKARLEDIVAQCREWVAAGVKVLDVGGESTRPGATPVERKQERDRVVPVIQALVTALPEAVVSVDTRHAQVARAALAAGAAIVNDVSGLADPYMPAVVAEAGAGLVIGHMRGEPATMQTNIEFEELFEEVAAELKLACDQAVGSGVSAEQILVDPCIGFGKTAEQSAALVASSAYLQEQTGRPVLIGASRKRFLGQLSGVTRANERKLASVSAALVAASHGASFVRVHDVPETIEVLRVQAGIHRAFNMYR